jgi:uncharacterized protein (DUF342 family)
LGFSGSRCSYYEAQPIAKGWSPDQGKASTVTTKTEDQQRIIPSREATLLALAKNPRATVGLTEREEAIAQEIDARRLCQHDANR